MKSKLEVKELLPLLPFVLSLGLAMDLYLPSINKIPEALCTKAQLVQWTLSGFMVSYGIGVLFVGPLCDAFGRRPLIIAGSILFTLSSLLCALTDSIGTLIFARCLQSLGTCMTAIPAFALIKDDYDKKASEQGMTFLKGSMALAPILAPSLGALIESVWGFRGCFHTLTFLGLLIFFFSLRVTESLPTIKRHPLTGRVFLNYFQLLSHKTFLLCSGLLICAQCVLFSFFSSSPKIIIETLGYSENFFALCFGLNALVYMGASAIGSFSLRKLGLYKTILIGCFLIFSGGALMTSLNFILGVTLWGLLGPIFLSSSGYSFIAGPATSLGVEAFRTKAGTATALLACLEFSVAGFVGSFSVGERLTDNAPLGIILTLSGIFALLFWHQLKKTDP